MAHFGPKSDILVFDQVDANGEVDKVNRRHVLPVGVREVPCAVFDKHI